MIRLQNLSYLFNLQMNEKSLDYDDKLRYQNRIKDERNSKKQQEIQQQKEDNVQNKNEQMDEYLLSPANPIIDKQKEPDAQISIKLIDIEGKNVRNNYRYLSKSLANSNKCSSQIDKPLQRMTLFNGYDPSNLLYRKFNNLEANQLNRKKYFSSFFLPFHLMQNGKYQMTVKLPQFQGMLKAKSIDEMKKSLIANLEDELQFDSNFQSGNLFAVFKTGPYNYDLILQNDLNTTGCTQWFYFAVKNRKNKNMTAHFNIVNLYKTFSLYNKGMKPMVFSQISGKGWRRKGQNIYYEKNCIYRQNSKKYYSSLSFTYDFTKGNDTVYFAHSIPYTHERLLELLKKVESSNKCKIKSLGMTPLKKSIPIIKFQSQDSKIDKKAIILMARQHPGEVQGSFTIEEILLNLIKPSSQIEFLLWRLNIYVIPMVNIDGVFLGNYRCNSMGFDLNRNWQGQQKSKHPQIIYIKNEIKKIMSKQPIQLIIDFHGHSNKMNSFFYGNPFGPNPLIFPFVAAKNCPFISFEDSTFNLEKKQKSKTARSVLGNLIKETGNVYTYEISFYGGLKNGKIVNFTEQIFRQLGRQILTTMYKVFIESYKEQKVFKQSSYLKVIRKETSKFENKFCNTETNGSDSQASQEREQLEDEKNEEIKVRLKEFFQQDENRNFQRYISNFEGNSEKRKGISYSLNLKNNSLTKKKVHQEISQSLKNLNRNKSLKTHNIDSLITINQKNEYLEEKIRKQKLFSENLRIFGQNYFPQFSLGNQNPKNNFLERSLTNIQSVFQDRRRQALRVDYIIKTRAIRNRDQNFSTLSPTKNEWKDQEPNIQDIVKINRLQYKKIQRTKSKVKNKNMKQKKPQDEGIFRLPSIVSNYKF